MLRGELNCIQRSLCIVRVQAFQPIERIREFEMETVLADDGNA